MYFVGFFFAFLRFPQGKENSRTWGIWGNGANMMCGLATYIKGFRTVLDSSFQWSVDGCFSNSFFHSFFFPDSYLAVVASRRVRSVADGTTAVIGGTGLCVMVTFALCACDCGETLVFNVAVWLAVKTLHDLGFREVGFNWVRLTVQIQGFPYCLVGQVRCVEFHVNTCVFESCDVWLQPAYLRDGFQSCEERQFGSIDIVSQISNLCDFGRVA